MPETLTARHRAVELEQDAVRFPDERVEILQEAAGQWKLAGEPERAAALWRELIDTGEEVGYARYELLKCTSSRAMVMMYHDDVHRQQEQL